MGWSPEKPTRWLSVRTRTPQRRVGRAERPPRTLCPPPGAMRGETGDPCLTLDTPRPATAASWVQSWSRPAGQGQWPQMPGGQPQPTAPAHHPDVPASLRRPPRPAVQQESADLRPFCCAWPSEVTSGLESQFPRARNGGTRLDDREGRRRSDLVKTAGDNIRNVEEFPHVDEQNTGSQQRKGAAATGGRFPARETPASSELTGRPSASRRSDTRTKQEVSPRACYMGEKKGRKRETRCQRCAR